jgi:hypothetical protein
MFCILVNTCTDVLEMCGGTKCSKFVFKFEPYLDKFEGAIFASFLCSYIIRSTKYSLTSNVFSSMFNTRTMCFQ